MLQSYYSLFVSGSRDFESRKNEMGTMENVNDNEGNRQRVGTKDMPRSQGLHLATLSRPQRAFSTAILFALISRDIGPLQYFRCFESLRSFSYRKPSNLYLLRFLRSKNKQRWYNLDRGRWCEPVRPLLNEGAPWWYVIAYTHMHTGAD